MSDVRNGWYVPSKPTASGRLTPRWVLGVIGGRVHYSDGSDKHRTCLADSFERWIKSRAAERKSDH